MNTYFFLQLSDLNHNLGFRFHQQCKVLNLFCRFYHNAKMTGVNVIHFALDIKEIGNYIGQYDTDNFTICEGRTGYE